jgi:hypothetical protein
MVKENEEFSYYTGLIKPWSSYSYNNALWLTELQLQCVLLAEQTGIISASPLWSCAPCPGHGFHCYRHWQLWHLGDPGTHAGWWCFSQLDSRAACMGMTSGWDYLVASDRDSRQHTAPFGVPIHPPEFPPSWPAGASTSAKHAAAASAQ